MLLTEIVETFDVKLAIDKLRADLAELGIKSPAFSAGFCFHAAARLYDALHAKYPSHEIVILHDGAHVVVHDFETDTSYDATGFGKTMGWHQSRPPKHQWKDSAALVKFLKRNEKKLRPESVTGLKALE
jgi:hypothetical protein